MKLVHLSDLHFGKIAHPAIVPALIDEVNGRDVDLVAISGDLTQRARHREFRAAVAMFEQLHAPTLVVPGNHDVFPWWFPVRRLFQPLARYQSYFGSDLWPTHETDGLSVLGVNSAHGRTIKGGMLGTDVHVRVHSYFDRITDRDFKVLVLHHHLTKIQSLGPHDVARNARHTLEAAATAGVDLVLCGHLHVSHIEPLPIRPLGHQLVVASAGTATSSRGRDSNRDTNFFNLIEVFDDRFVIEERKYNLETNRFEIEASREFERANQRARHEQSHAREGRP